jgi:hypothetical protein
MGKLVEDIYWLNGMTKELISLQPFWYQGLDALLNGDEALAQSIWMSVILESQIDEVDAQTRELSKILENTVIKLLQAGNYGGAKRCYEMALEIDETFENTTLEQILQWREFYTESCKKKGYHFTTDWFSGNIPIWNQVLRKFIGSPNLSFLEVGSWEGRATCWLLENILIDESSTITCIDTFQGSMEHEEMGLGNHLQSLEAVFDHNIERTGKTKQVKKLKGLSQGWLSQLPAETFDFYYVDGSHVAPDVLTDAVLGWRLLKEGGIIIFDDYEWDSYRNQPTLHPKLAVDSFLTVFEDQIKPIYQGYQVIVEKMR